MASKVTYSETLRNPYTGEIAEITATTENALQNKINKQIKIWEKEQAEWEHQQYVNNQYQYVQKIDQENWERLNNLKYRMLSYIKRWAPYRYYEGLKRKRNYSQIQAPPTIKDISKELKVPKKIDIWEFFSDERKNKRIAAEKKAEEVLQKRMKEYKERAAAYDKKSAEFNQEIDNRHQLMRDGNQKEIVDFFTWVIGQDCEYLQGYYVGFRNDKYLHYDPKLKLLAIDIEMPAKHRIPDVESFQYEEKKDNIKANRMTQANYKSFYNHVICDLALRIISVVYESDEYSLVASVVINGYRIYLDRSRGKHINDCIISVNISREEYDEIYLRNADGEEVIRRVSKNVPGDMTSEPIGVKPLFDSGNLNVYYISER